MKSAKGKSRIKPYLITKKDPLPIPYIQLHLSTWLKDSHGLYDYQAIESKCQTQIINISKSSKIYRHITTLRTQIIDEDDSKQMPIQSIYIGTLIVDRQTQTYKIQSAAITGVLPHPLVRQAHPDLFHNSFIVIKDFQKDEGYDGYPLNPGNVIKLGRVQYVILQVKTNTKVQTYKQTSHLQLNKGNHIVDKPLQGVCKICLCQQSTEDDPLITPCICKGSCQFIHVGCLKNWINSKVKKQLNQIVVSYNFSKFQCQICKAPFPKTITIQNQNVIQMITIEKSLKPYLILQSVNGKQQKKQRNLHMIFSNNGNPLKVGRGHQCQMRVNDISVSRIHAEIRFQNNKFYIKDLKSKFVKLQYGRVCMQFKLKTEAPKLQEETNQDDDCY